MIGSATVLLIVVVGIYLGRKWRHRFHSRMNDSRYSAYRLTAIGHDELLTAEQTLFDDAEQYHDADGTEWHDWQTARLKKVGKLGSNHGQ